MNVCNPSLRSTFREILQAYATPLVFPASVFAVAGFMIGAVYLYGRVAMVPVTDRGRPAFASHHETCVHGSLYLRFTEGATIALDNTGRPIPCSPSEAQSTR